MKIHDFYLSADEQLALKHKIVQIEEGIEWKQTATMGLFDGLGGLLLFYAYRKKSLSTVIHDEKIIIIAQKIFSWLFGNRIMSFGHGKSGLLWLLSFLKGERIIAFEDETTEIKQSIRHYAQESIEVENFDFIYGFDGVLLYLLDQECDEAYIQKLLSLLNSKAVESQTRYYWRDCFLPSEKSETNINLGVAHGLGSKISLLSVIIERFPNLTLAKQMLTKCVNCLLLFINHDPKVSFFPNGSESQNLPSRLAWCYGDLGMSICLLRSAIVLKDMRLYNLAVKIALFSATRRSQVSTGVQDSSLCHGSSGICQIFTRLFYLTGLVEFNEARHFWMRQILTEENFPKRETPYKSSVTGNKEIDFSLLTGAAGIGLSLLSFVHESPESFNWDRCLLLTK